MRTWLVVLCAISLGCSATRTRAGAADDATGSSLVSDAAESSSDGDASFETGDAVSALDDVVPGDDLSTPAALDTEAPPQDGEDLPLADMSMPPDAATWPQDLATPSDAPEIEDAPSPDDTAAADTAAPPPSAASLAQALASDGSALAALVDSWDGPRCDASGCLVVSRAVGAQEVWVVGPFVEWDATAGLALAPVPGHAGWFAGLVTPAPSTPTPYRLVVDGAWSDDALNPYVLFGGFGFDNALVPPGFGRITRVTSVASPQLGNTRDLFVYLPAAYFTDAERRFPVLYLQDGFNVFRNPQAPFGTWDVEVTADTLAAAGEAAPVILVGVDTNNREAEYVQAPLEAGGSALAANYVDFLADTVRPLVDGTFRTQTAAAVTGVGGSSLGGLLALYAGWSRPDAFGRVAAFSSAFWVGESAVGEPEGPSVRELVDQNPLALGPEDLRIYLDCGDTDSDGVAYASDGWWLTDWTRNALLRQGWPGHPEWSTPGSAGAPADLPAATPVSDVPHLAWTEPPPPAWLSGALLAVVGHGHAHNEAAWRARFGVALRFLYPPVVN